MCGSSRETVTSQARFALYFTPAPGSALARFGADILGYDCDAGTLVARRSLDGIDPQAAAAATAEPVRYGFHGTLMAPFALSPSRSVDELADGLAAFAASRAPVPLGRLKVAPIGGFTALVPAGPEDAVRTLAGDCVTAFNDFRAPLSARDRERRLAGKLSPRQIELLDRWGYPYVFSEFRFHMTLTGRLPAHDQARWVPALAAAFAPLAEAAIDIDAISLLCQDDRDALFRVIARQPLQGDGTSVSTG
jgi:putative phosphonate metabolism protein